MKPKIGIYSLTGCGGDQLMILNLEDVLLELLSRFDIKEFQEASSRRSNDRLDIAFVEGSVSTGEDLERLEEIRKRSDLLIAMGDCAINGCVQAMRNGQTSISKRLQDVYGVDSEYFDVLEPKGLNSYVKVDLEIPGCPIEKDEFLHYVTSLLHGDLPIEIDYPVCVECKLNEYPCVIVEEGKPCLGPLIRAGCDARCPGLGLDCIGCRGTIPTDANIAGEIDLLLEKGYDLEYISNRLRMFGGGSVIISELIEVDKDE